MATPSTSQNVPDTVHVITADKTNSDVLLILPDPRTCTRCIRYVKVFGNNSNVARLTPAWGLIDDQAYWETTHHRKGLIIVADGARWLIVGEYD